MEGTVRHVSVSFFSAYFIQAPGTCEAVDKDDHDASTRWKTVGRCYNSRQGSCKKNIIKQLKKKGTKDET